MPDPGVILTTLDRADVSESNWLRSPLHTCTNYKPSIVVRLDHACLVGRELHVPDEKGAALQNHVNLVKFVHALVKSYIQLSGHK